MKFCYHCGVKLSAGKEIFCPECGTKLEQTEIEDKKTGPSIDIKDTKGDVIGVGSSGSGNISGKVVDYTVNGNVINLNVNNMSSEVVKNLKEILSVQTQLPAADSTKEDYKKDVTKFEELKDTQQKITNVLDEVKQIEKKEGTQIRKIKAGDLQISTDDLFVKNALAKGTELYYKGEYSNALEWYEKAILTDPMNAEAWYNKGLALANVGKIEESILCFDKVIEINPLALDALYSKGLSLAKLGKYEESIKFNDKVIEINPGYVDAWNNKGLALYYLRKYEQGISCFDKALQIQPDYYKAWNNIGIILGTLGKYEQAISCFDKSIEINPGYVDAWNNKRRTLEIIRKNRGF